MLVDVDYLYSVREWGSDTFEVEDPDDRVLIEGLVKDELKLIYGEEGIVSDIKIEKIKKVVRLDA